MTYTPCFTSFDEALQLRNIFSGSVMVQRIIDVARTRASVYMVTNPNAIIFDDDGQVIDPMYDSFYAEAVRDVKAVVAECKKRNAAKATQPLRQARM